MKPILLLILLAATSAYARTTPRVSEQLLKKFDRNGNGILTHGEYPQKEIFDAVDADKDGFATVDEVRAYYAKRRAQPEPKKQ